MCLITEQKVAKIAEEDTIVYKEVILLGDEKCMSSIQGFEYEFDKLYTSVTLSPKSIIGLRFADDFTMHDPRVADYYFLDKIVIYDKGEIVTDNECCDYVVISKGFHAYTNFERDKDSNVKCIIPKGSEYFEDATGLIVSNRIIIKEIIKN